MTKDWFLPVAGASTLVLTFAFTSPAIAGLPAESLLNNAPLLLSQIFIPLPGLAKPKPPPPPPPPPAPAPLEPSKTQLQKPATVLADVNKNYTNTASDCTQAGSAVARGLYYCSGVLVRTVTPGHVPWSYSPNAVQIGATSYTWLRNDTGITGVFHPAGFILRNPADALSRNLPGLETGFICLYPFDSWTTTSNGQKGCGLKPRAMPPLTGNNNASYAYGSCEGIAVTTAEQWNADFDKQGQDRTKQCSWNVEDPVGWRASISAHSTYPNLSGMWNELLLSNYDNGNSMPQYISAFFYDIKQAGGLATAQDFQKKMNAAGYNVPILRLDFTASADGRFSYDPADQAVVQ